MISNAINDHMVMDLRNTSEDHRFALRYSSDNSGVADKIVISAGHYIYNTDNPNFDSSSPVSSTNPQQIPETRQGHVGINCVPTQDYHLDVNGNMRITGSFVVDGASTTIQAANMSVQDKNITLNISPSGTTTNASTFNAGILIQGDNNTITGYVKVHPLNIDQLVAKAPAGQEINFDINGSATSTIRMEESLLEVNKSPTSFISTSTSMLSSTIDVSTTDIHMADTSLNATNSTIDTVDSSLNLTSSSITMNTGSITVQPNADLIVEKDSWIDQDLTIDSKTVQFDGLYTSGVLTIPTANGSIANWAGSVRYNATKGQYQGNVGSSQWVPFNGTLSDNDGDTYVQTVEGATDALEFYVDNERVLFMDGNKAEFNTKYGFTIPAGPTSDRPGDNIVTPGSFRFNTEHNHFEGHNGDNWFQAGGVIDSDRDTYWTAHADEPPNVPLGSELWHGRVHIAQGPGSTEILVKPLGGFNVVDADGKTITTAPNVYQGGGYALAGMTVNINGQNYLIDRVDDFSGLHDVNQMFRIYFAQNHGMPGIHDALLTTAPQGTSMSAQYPTTGVGGSAYPGDPDKLRAFISDAQAFEIDSNATRFFNAGTKHLTIDHDGASMSRLTSDEGIQLDSGGAVSLMSGNNQGTTIDSGGDISISSSSDITVNSYGLLTLVSDQVDIPTHNGHGSAATVKGLSLGGEMVYADSNDINRTDITTVGQSQNNKVLTQSHNGRVTIGNGGGNQILNIMSHDEVDAGLMLNGTLVKANANELNKLDGATLTTTQLNFLTAPGLEKSDLIKLGGVSSTASQLNYLTATGLTKADLEKLAAINASAAEINDLYNNAVDGSDFSKLSNVTASATELNLVDGATTDGSGSVVAGKAVIAGTDKSVSGINELSSGSLVTTGNITSTSGRVKASSGEIVGDLQTGTATVAGLLNVGSVSSSGYIEGTTITGTSGSFSAGVSILGGNLVTSSTSDITGGKNLYIAGNAYVSGEVHSSSASDIKLKSNLKKISNPLKKLSSISGYEFDWNEHDERSGQHDIGVVAQEVQQVLPEIVEEKANDTLGVRYDKMIPLLIECIKDQQQQIDYLAKLVAQK